MICWRWGLESPVHQEEYGAAVKPLRRECRSDFGVPVLACVRLFRFARKAVGAACTRDSLRPLISEGHRFQSPDANHAAGMPSVAPDKRAHASAIRDPEPQAVV